MIKNIFEYFNSVKIKTETKRNKEVNMTRVSFLPQYEIDEILIKTNNNNNNINILRLKCLK